MQAVAVAVGLVASCLILQVNGAPVEKNSLQGYFSDDVLQAFAQGLRDLSTANFIYAATGQFGDLELCGCWVIGSAPADQAKIASKYLGHIKATIQDPDVSVNIFYDMDEYGNLNECGCYSSALPEAEKEGDGN